MPAQAAQLFTGKRTSYSDTSLIPRLIFLRGFILYSAPTCLKTPARVTRPQGLRTASVPTPQGWRHHKCPTPQGLRDLGDPFYSCAASSRYRKKRRSFMSSWLTTNDLVLKWCRFLTKNLWVSGSLNFLRIISGVHTSKISNRVAGDDDTLDGTLVQTRRVPVVGLTRTSHWCLTF